MATEKSEKKEQISVEKGLQRLEEIVDQLEGGSVNLDQSFKIFEKAVSISKRISKKLAGYERKIEMIDGAASTDTKPAFTDPPEDLN